MKPRVAVIAIALLGLTQAAGAQQEPSALVQLATAEQGTLHPSIGAYGTVAADPAYVAAIALPRDGIITAVSVRAGQVVNVGQPIVTFDTAPSTLAGYQQAQSAVTLAQQDLAHTEELFKQQLATNSQVAAAQKTLADAEAQLRAQTQIGAQRQSRTLNATSVGIVIAVNAAGDIYWNNGLVATTQELIDKIKAKAVVKPQPEIHIRADKDALFQSVGRVLYSIQRGGIVKVGFITQPDAASLAESIAHQDRIG